MRKLLDLSGVAFVVVVITTALQLSGCGTYATWTPRTGTSVEAYHERSCASGYYDCGIGSRGGSGGPHH